MKNNYIVKITAYGLHYYLTTSLNWSFAYFDDRIGESCIFEEYTEDEIIKIVKEERERNPFIYEIWQEVNDWESKLIIKI